MESYATVAEAGKRQNQITTTMDYKLRDKLLAPYYSTCITGGLRYFTGVPLNVLEQLINHNFVEMGPWNSCDGVSDSFLPFLRRHPNFTAHGYSVLPEREDVRVSIEGVEQDTELTKEEIIDFAVTFRDADEMILDTDYARCWYD
jgi:hypothetical protein